MDKKAKRVLLIIFLISLPISHYGITIIFLLLLLLGFIVFHILTFILQKWDMNHNMDSNTDLFRPILIIIFLFFIFIWNVYTTSQMQFNRYVFVFDRLLNLFADYSKAGTTSAVAMQMVGMGVSQSSDIVRSIGRFFTYSIEFLYLSGLLAVLFFSKKFRFRREYLILIFCAFGIFGFFLFYPSLFQSFNYFRFITPVLLIGAPLVVIGFETICNIVVVGISPISKRLHFRTYLKTLYKKQVFTSKNCLAILICFFLIPNFLFSSGIVNQVMRIGDSDYSYRFSQSLNRWDMDISYCTEGEVDGAKWIADYYKNDMHFTTDSFSSWLIRYNLLLQHEQSYQIEYDQRFSINDNIPNDNYIFLRRWNVRTGTISDEKGPIPFIGYSPQITNAFFMRNKIFSNGESVILSGISN